MSEASYSTPELRRDFTDVYHERGLWKKTSEKGKFLRFSRATNHKQHMADLQHKTGSVVTTIKLNRIFRTMCTHCTLPHSCTPPYSLNLASLEPCSPYYESFYHPESDIGASMSFAEEPQSCLTNPPGNAGRVWCREDAGVTHWLHPAVSHVQVRCDTGLASQHLVDRSSAKCSWMSLFQHGCEETCLAAEPPLTVVSNP